MNPVRQPSWLQPRHSPASPAAGSSHGLSSGTPAQGDTGAGPSAARVATPEQLGADPIEGAPGQTQPQSTQPEPGAELTPTERRKAWQRIWDSPASNRAKALVWRLQHARLPCGLYLATKGRSERALCSHAECQQQPQPQQRQHQPQRQHQRQQQQLDSLTHIFVTCPAYSEARTWLAALWGSVTGTDGPPMDNVELMLGDWPSAWGAYPTSPGLQRLWTTLRTTWLWAVWCHHQAADTAASPSEAVVEQTVGELQRLMWAHFRMSALPDDTLAGLP